MSKSIGDRLRQVIASKEMSMAALASLAKLPYRSVQNYVSGEQKPGADALLKLREALGVDLDWLLSGEVRSATRDEFLRNPSYAAIDRVFSATGDHMGSTTVFFGLLGAALTSSFFHPLNEDELLSALGRERASLFLSHLRDVLIVFLWRRRDVLIINTSDTTELRTQQLIDAAANQITPAVNETFQFPWGDREATLTLSSSVAKLVGDRHINPYWFEPRAETAVNHRKELGPPSRG